MEQLTLTTEATESVRRNIGKLIDAGLYNADASWVEGYFAALQPIEVSKIIVDNPPELKMPVGKKLYDLENCLSLFSAYPNLTFHQAASENLWAYMTHVQYWEYMRRRWPVENIEGRQENYIKEHYFLKGGSDRSLIHNGIARLWWYAKLTYDATAEQPSRLTEVLLSQLDITQNLLERSWGSSRSLLLGCLEFLAANPKLTKGTKGRFRIRDLFKSITLEGGISVLDMRSKEEVAAFLETRNKQLGELA
jgi:hypothetical protein